MGPLLFTVIDFVESVRNLGVTMDYRLRFVKHIDKCIRKSYINLRKIFSIRKLINIKTKVILSEALVLSNFNFAVAVYGPCLDSKKANRIQIVQNSCLRLIFTLKRNAHVLHKLNSIPWLNIKSRPYIHCACQFHKILLCRSPPYLYNKIRYRPDVHNINIRKDIYKDELTVPRHNSTLFKTEQHKKVALF